MSCLSHNPFDDIVANLSIFLMCWYSNFSYLSYIIVVRGFIVVIKNIPIIKKRIVGATIKDTGLTPEDFITVYSEAFSSLMNVTIHDKKIMIAKVSNINEK